MPRRLRQFPQRSTPANRSWAGGVETVYTVVPAASKILLSSFTLSNPGIDETVLRTVGLISIASDSVSASEAQIGAFGMIVVSTTALAVGITAIPSPVTDISDDGWFNFQAFANDQKLLSSVGLIADFSKEYIFDSKAKRVVSEGQAIAVVAENAHSATGLTIQASIRMLSMVRGT